MTILCEPIGAKIKIPSPLRGPGISAPSRLAALFLVGTIDKTKPAFRCAKAQVFLPARLCKRSWSEKNTRHPCG